MRLLCYADDPREPELIGETQVDLSEALSKGETDGELLVEYISSVSDGTRCRMVHVDEQG